MKNPLNENELDQVNGGSVYLSEKRMKVGFDTTGEKFNILVDFKTVRRLVYEMYDDNPNMSNEQFDALVKERLLNLGYIG